MEEKMNIDNTGSNETPTFAATSEAAGFVVEADLTCNHLVA
jgi:hypothetical protein